MARREGRNALPHSFFTPLTLPARIIVDLAFSLPCWCVRLDRCCVELHFVLEMLLLFSMAITTLWTGNWVKMPPKTLLLWKSTQHPPNLKHDLKTTTVPPPPRGLWRTCSWASNIFTRWSYSLQWQMVVLTHGAWFTFRRFLWNDHVLISGASAKHCPRWTSQKEQRWLRTRYLTCVFRALNDKACK